MLAAVVVCLITSLISVLPFGILSAQEIRWSYLLHQQLEFCTPLWRKWRKTLIQSAAVVISVLRCFLYGLLAKQYVPIWRPKIKLCLSHL